MSDNEIHRLEFWYLHTHKSMCLSELHTHDCVDAHRVVDHLQYSRSGRDPLECMCCGTPFLWAYVCVCLSESVCSKCVAPVEQKCVGDIESLGKGCVLVLVLVLVLVREPHTKRGQQCVALSQSQGHQYERVAGPGGRGVSAQPERGTIQQGLEDWPVSSHMHMPLTLCVCVYMYIHVYICVCAPTADLRNDAETGSQEG